MNNIFTRLEGGIGKKNIELLNKSTVVVIGIGGVGSYAVEALARSAVGKLVLVDKDTVDITNINRQIHALHSTIGKSKTLLMKDRISDINPDCEVITIDEFLSKDNFDKILVHKPNFVIDASDTITYKIDFIELLLNNKIKFISSMGAANKMDPTKFEIMDIRKTSYDPIAKIIRKKIKEKKITKKIPVICSTEVPKKSSVQVTDSSIRKEKQPPSSNAFVPSVAGLIAASYVVNNLIDDNF